MEEQTLIQFRADKLLKQEVAEIYEKLRIALKLGFGKQNMTKHSKGSQWIIES